MAVHTMRSHFSSLLYIYARTKGSKTIQRALYIGTTSKFSLKQRHDLISTTFQRCSNVRCPLGTCSCLLSMKTFQSYHSVCNCHVWISLYLKYLLIPIKQNIHNFLVLTDIFFFYFTHKFGSLKLATLRSLLLTQFNRSFVPLLG